MISWASHASPVYHEVSHEGGHVAHGEMSEHASGQASNGCGGGLWQGVLHGVSQEY